MLGVLNVEAKTEKVYATFENPTNTNTTWDAATKTFTWSTTYYNQLRNIGLPTGDISKYKKLVVDCDIKTGNQFRILQFTQHMGMDGRNAAAADQTHPIHGFPSAFVITSAPLPLPPAPGPANRVPPP